MTLFRNGRLGVLLPVALLAVSGCTSSVERMSDSRLTLDTPIDWWHGLQGGKIAAQRPPPPGVDDPYPNLSQVPPRPTPTDPATRRALAARLVAERDRTRQEATQDPLVLPAPAAAAPATTASAAVPVPAVPAPAATRPAAPPPDPGASVAVLEAATAPPPVETPAPPPAAPSPAAPPARPAATAAPGGPLRGEPAAASGPVPDLPSEAPPLPRLRGIPASVNAPPVPRLPPGVSVAFRPGSAALPAGADAALRELAGRRAGAAIAVEAKGDAAGPGAAAQARALPLAWRRARSMGEALVAAGVPAGALRIDAAALGRGGEAHLLQ